MCTVVVRWSAGRPAQILALRDELTTRTFDDPDRWWPEFPDVIGGRDRAAGGTWCAVHVGTGAAAMVLNRPQRRIAEAGAASRGVLPLLAAVHEDDWPSQVDLAGMASFALVLTTAHRLQTWVYDGERLTASDHESGTHMVTSGGAEDGKADRYLRDFDAAAFPDGWRALVERASPQDDPAALVVRHALDDAVYATVFGQLVEAAPGQLRLEHSRTPWVSGSWRAVQQRAGQVPTMPTNDTISPG